MRRPAINRYVLIQDALDGNGEPLVTGLCAARSMAEAALDAEEAGLTGEIVTRAEYRNRPEYEKELRDRQRSRILGRLARKVNGIDMVVAAAAEIVADDTMLTPRVKRLRAIRARFLERSQFARESLSLPDLEAYDPETDAELEE